MDKKKERLAITTVPMQSWGDLYDEDEALKAGTIFKDLDLPFFAAKDIVSSEAPGSDLMKSPEQRDREKMMCEIQKISFVLDDLRLYLDTHPDDARGLAELKKALTRRKQLTEEFAEQYYPLTPDCMAEIYERKPEAECFCWQKGPKPWEGACV